jgi:hypothetical protein
MPRLFDETLFWISFTITRTKTKNIYKLAGNLTLRGIIKLVVVQLIYWGAHIKQSIKKAVCLPGCWHHQPPQIFQQNEAKVIIQKKRYIFLRLTVISFPISIVIKSSPTSKGPV